MNNKKAEETKEISLRPKRKNQPASVSRWLVSLVLFLALPAFCGACLWIDINQQITAKGEATPVLVYAIAGDGTPQLTKPTGEPLADGKITEKIQPFIPAPLRFIYALWKKEVLAVRYYAQTYQKQFSHTSGI